jgi:hypothetical protein
MTKIPRGKYLGGLAGGTPGDEAEHFIRRPVCAGWMDCRDLGQVFEHEGAVTTPSTGSAAVTSRIRLRRR